MIETSQICGVVLAGGKSRRMGTDKSAVEIDGKSLLAIAADKLRRIFPEVIIAGVSKDSPEIDLPVYADVFEGYGPVGGLYTALLNTARPHIFLLPVDMPHVSEELIRRICSLSESGKANIPVCGDLAQPLCAIYPESMKLRAEYILCSVEHPESAGNQLSIYRLARMNNNLIQIDNCGDQFINVNTPEDLEKAKRFK